MQGREKEGGRGFGQPFAPAPSPPAAPASRHPPPLVHSGPHAPRVRGFGYPRTLGKAGRADEAPHLDHPAVVDRPIAAPVEHCVGVAAGDLLQARPDRFWRYFRTLLEDPSFTVDRDAERLFW